MELRRPGRRSRWRSGRRALPLLVGVVLAAARPGLAADPRSDYELLLEWRTTRRPLPLPAGGLVIAANGASWRLEEGELRLSQPLADGTLTGLVFEGHGTFRFEIADPFELEQLRRFAESGEIEALELSFERLLLRTPDLAGLVDLHLDGTPSFDRDKLVASRHEHWLERRRIDVDARILAARARPVDDYLRVEVDTEEYGWLTWEREASRDEPVQLYRYHNGYLETWVSLRREFLEGEADLRRAFDVLHVDVEIDLVEPGKYSRQGLSRQHPRAGDFRVSLNLEVAQEWTSVLVFQLDAFAQLRAVRRDGEELTYLRNRIGEGSRELVDELEEDELAVFFETPLHRGERATLELEYEMEVLNYLPGRSWYPGLTEGALADLHTGRITAVLPERIEARGMGRASEPLVDTRADTVSRTWTVEEPTRMLTLVFAEKSLEETLEVPGRPSIRVFGPRKKSSSRRFLEVAQDVSDALAFFEDRFGSLADDPEILVTRIVASHGQAFRGFLQLSEGTFYIDSKGPSQLFRAHEVAHQWWGHALGWASYRDQWISEALSEYCAMMFVESEPDDGHELFEEMLTTYRNEQLGSIASSMSRFARPWMMHLNDQARARLGPISLGYRIATHDAVTGYGSQVYQKGSLVLHMLRLVLRGATGSDDAFLAGLRHFAEEHRDEQVTTDDLREALENASSMPLGWFFDQWIHGTAIPTYSWSYTSHPTAEGAEAVLVVEQENVPSGFRMPLPVLFRFAGGREETRIAVVAEPRVELSFSLPEEPRSVELAPGPNLLARFRKR